MPLAPGEEMTLRMYDAAYWSSYSRVSWPPDAGATIWAQVDSANIGSAYGAVLEDHELSGDFYNNFDIVVYGTTGMAAAVADADVDQPLTRLDGALPPRTAPPPTLTPGGR